MLAVKHIETYALSVQVGDVVWASVHWSETVQQFRVSGTEFVLLWLGKALRMVSPPFQKTLTPAAVIAGLMFSCVLQRFHP